jgi:hypothetical protein
MNDEMKKNRSHESWTAGQFPSCRASPLAAHFARCMGNPPAICTYRLSFRGHAFCYHPDRDLIVMQTVAEKNQKASAGH